MVSPPESGLRGNTVFVSFLLLKKEERKSHQLLEENEEVGPLEIKY
jgi:hypothetical protein